MEDPVLVTEVAPGLVLEFDQQRLEIRRGIQSKLRLGSMAGTSARPGPFVCINVCGTTSTWSQLTRVFRKERLEVPKVWKSGGYDQWINDATYLNDGANLYIGESVEFLSACVESSSRSARRRVVEAALAAIGSEVAR